MEIIFDNQEESKQESANSQEKNKSNMEIIEDNTKSKNKSKL